MKKLLNREHVLDHQVKKIGDLINLWVHHHVCAVLKTSLPPACIVHDNSNKNKKLFSKTAFLELKFLMAWDVIT